jgi:hypothetical protein
VLAINKRVWTQPHFSVLSSLPPSQWYVCSLSASRLTAHFCHIVYSFLAVTPYLKSRLAVSCTTLLSSFGILIFLRSHSRRDEKISTPGPQLDGLPAPQRSKWHSRRRDGTRLIGSDLRLLKHLHRASAKNPPNNIFPCLPKAPPRHRRSTPNRRSQKNAPELGARVQTMNSGLQHCPPHRNTRRAQKSLRTDSSRKISKSASQTTRSVSSKNLRSRSSVSSIS